MNNYHKLRPEDIQEVCNCSEVNQLLLVYTLTCNPIHCYTCKGSIDPESIKLSEYEVDLISSWHNVFSALYHLWLDSGQYELWAKEKLLENKGEVNKSGLAVVNVLSKKIPTYYWWFHSAEDLVPVNCPNCNKALDNDNRHGHGKCVTCHVVV
jgi:hypothetical protein